MSPQYRGFLKLLTKSFLTLSVKNLGYILVELLLKLRIVVIQDSEDGKRSTVKMARENSELLQNVHRVEGCIGRW